MLLVDIDYEKAKKLLLKAIDVVEDIDTLPGASEKECGNYKEHDLEAAKQELKKYKEIIE
jgi:S-ribosylhomocysteine lyase LuxS involved in autoinducer biosynthesis